MDKQIKRRILTLTLSVIITSSIYTSTFASEVISNINITDNQLKKDVLYVIDREDYRQILKKDTLLLKNKDSLIVLEDETSEEDIEYLNSAKSLHILGELVNSSQLSKLNNIKDISHSKDKDIIVVNKDSLADQFTASQLSELDNRSILTVDTNNLDEVKEWLSENGKDKNFLFLEGEFELPIEVRNEILEIASNEKYEIDVVEISKSSIKLDESQANKDIKVELPYDTESNVKASQVLDKANELSTDIVNKSKKDSDELLYNKNKLIVYESKQDNYGYIDLSENNETDNDFIKTIQEDESLTVKINDKIDNVTDDNSYNLRLTYANPVDLNARIDTDKEIFITPRQITDEVVFNTMEGDYGNGEERKHNLEQLGFNYEEVQSRIEAIVEERRIEHERILREQRESEQRQQGPRVRMQLNPSPARNVNLFINEALSMKGWAYSQPKRWEYGYADCSSIVIRALINSGVTNDLTNLTTRTIHRDPRFYEIPMDKIEKGDILWYHGHMEIYMGGDSTFGAFRPGKPAGYASNVSRFNRAYRISGN